MPPPYTVVRTQSFLDQWQEAYDWLLESNFEQTEDFDLSKRRADLLTNEINTVVKNLEHTPNIGSKLDGQLTRSFPVHDGRYSLRWVVNSATVNLVGLADNERPKALRYKMEDDE